jgi:hypothetical protein
MALAKPKNLPLFIKQGETVRFRLEIAKNGLAVDVEEWSFAAQVRAAQSASATLISVFDIAPVGQPEDGVIELALEADVTAALQPGVYFWDLKWTTAEGDVRIPIDGTFEVIARVTA